VLDNFIRTPLPVICRVFEVLAQNAGRLLLEDHGKVFGRKLPARSPWRHVGAGQIHFLVARAAQQSILAQSFRSPHYIHDVGMAVISLERAIPPGVAVYAPGVGKHHGRLKKSRGGRVFLRRNVPFGKYYGRRYAY
jgi:hypothetical protein